MIPLLHRNPDRPTAGSTSEVLFTRLYGSLIRRKHDPPATTFLLGFDMAALQAEKSLFGIAEWMRADKALAGYAVQISAKQLEADLGHETPPQALPVGLWAESRLRFQPAAGNPAPFVNETKTVRPRMTNSTPTITPISDGAMPGLLRLRDIGETPFDPTLSAARLYLF
jgi:hypothetical protein